jgi:hypothetical protein
MDFEQWIEQIQSLTISVWFRLSSNKTEHKHKRKRESREKIKSLNSLLDGSHSRNQNRNCEWNKQIRKKWNCFSIHSGNSVRPPTLELTPIPDTIEPQDWKNIHCDMISITVNEKRVFFSSQRYWWLNDCFRIPAIVSMRETKIICSMRELCQSPCHFPGSRNDNQWQSVISTILDGWWLLPIRVILRGEKPTKRFWVIPAVSLRMSGGWVWKSIQ